MTPAEFDEACRQLWQAHPELSETSGRRSAERNASVGGKALSKHVLGMARDFAGPAGVLRDAAATARALGLWIDTHDVGSGMHLHVQGLAPGDVPAWWACKYLGGER
jgi:hypothetical protein